MPIERKFFIDETTLYMRRVIDPCYQTKIETLEHTHYSDRTAKQVLEKSCHYYGSSLNGRKASVKKVFQLIQTPAFPIDPIKELYCFVTHSERTPHCIYIFTKQLSYISYEKDAITFHFSNQKTLTVEMNSAKLSRVLCALYHYHLYFRTDNPPFLL